MGSNSKITDTYSISVVANKLNITVDKAEDLCKYGKIPGAFQIYINGPWRVPYYSFKQKIYLKITFLDKFKYFVKKNKILSILSSIIAFLFFLFALISAGADLYGFRDVVIRSGILPAYQKQQNNEILIVITSYYNYDGMPEHKIESFIRNYIIENTSDLEEHSIRVEIDPRKISTNDTRRIGRIGKRYNASIIISGEYTELEIITSILVNKDNYQYSYKLSDIDNSYLTNPNGYKNYIISELPIYVDFFGNIIKSYIYDIDNQIDKSEEVINYILENFETTNVSSENLALLYYSLGFFYITGYFESDLEILSNDNFSNLNYEKKLSNRINDFSNERKNNIIFYLKKSIELGLSNYQKFDNNAHFVLGIMLSTDGQGAECYNILTKKFNIEKSFILCKIGLQTSGFLLEDIELTQISSIKRLDYNTYCEFTNKTSNYYLRMIFHTVNQYFNEIEDKDYDYDKKELLDEYKLYLLLLNYSYQYNCENFGQDVDFYIIAKDYCNISIEKCFEYYNYLYSINKHNPPFIEFDL